MSVRILWILLVFVLAGCASPGQRLGNLDEYKNRLTEYKTSGAYDRDVAATFAEAEAWVRMRAPQVERPAIIMDIDETSLSNWPELKANGLTFRVDGPCDHLPKGPCGLRAWGLKAQAAGIAPAVHLFRTARVLGVDVFFITGRDETSRTATIRNLHRAGYEGWTELVMRPAHSTTPSAMDYKAPQRARIEAMGYRIIASCGDQPSDLAGGHAERIFLIPNPYYRIP